MQDEFYRYSMGLDTKKGTILLYTGELYSEFIRPGCLYVNRRDKGNGIVEVMTEEGWVYTVAKHYFKIVLEP